MKTTNLTIQEAIQSVLPYKLPENETWYDEIVAFINVKDITRTDWQIKVPEVTITREKIAEAWDKMIEKECLGLAKSEDSFAFDVFCKELGLQHE